MFAIVLLGYRNSGKDSLAKNLQEKFTGVVNAKFGGYNKYLASEILKVPVSWFEDKKWRETEYLENTGFTPLHLLNALFAYSKENKKMQTDIDKWTLESLDSSLDKVVVFTDIRRKRELDSVIDFFADNVFYIHLSRAGLKAQEGDEEIDALVDSVDLDFSFVGTLGENNNKLEQIVLGAGCARIPEVKRKPTLSLYLNPCIDHGYNVYEPLSHILKAVVKFAEDTKLPQTAAFPLFRTVVEELEPKNRTVADITQDSSMVFIPHQHLPYLKLMREKAKIQLVVPLHVLKEDWVQENFLPTEIYTHGIN